MQPIRIEDLAEPPLIGAIWLIFSWLWARGVNRAAKVDRLTTFQKIGIIYGTLFFLGAALILNIAAARDLRDLTTGILVSLWVLVLALMAAIRTRRRHDKVAAAPDQTV